MTYFIQNPRSTGTSVILGQRLYYGHRFAIVFISFYWIFQPSTPIFRALVSKILSYSQVYNHSSIKSLAQKRCPVTVCCAEFRWLRSNSDAVPFSTMCWDSVQSLPKTYYPDAVGPLNSNIVISQLHLGIHSLQNFSCGTHLLMTKLFTWH